MVIVNEFRSCLTLIVWLMLEHHTVADLQDQSKAVNLHIATIEVEVQPIMKAKSIQKCTSSSKSQSISTPT